jgi:hypothetical protein
MKLQFNRDSLTQDMDMAGKIWKITAKFVQEMGGQLPLNQMEEFCNALQEGRCEEFAVDDSAHIDKVITTHRFTRTPVRVIHRSRQSEQSDALTQRLFQWLCVKLTFTVDTFTQWLKEDLASEKRRFENTTEAAAIPCNHEPDLDFLNYEERIWQHTFSLSGYEGVPGKLTQLAPAVSMVNGRKMTVPLTDGRVVLEEIRVHCSVDRFEKYFYLVSLVRPYKKLILFRVTPGMMEHMAAWSHKEELQNAKKYYTN